MGWPDIAIVAVVLIAALKGLKRGFVAELGGALALLLSVVVPWFYNGTFDPFVERATHLGSGSAHVVAMFAVGIATYVAVLAIARALSTVARLPLLGTGNAAGGFLVGAAKAWIGLWLLLYVALFFPLSSDIRADLHRSPLVHELAAPNARVDGALIGTFPWFARPFVHRFFAQHRV